MKYRRRLNRAITLLLHAVFLVGLYILQSAIFPYLRLGGLVPLLLPAAVAGIALYEGRDIGGIYGLIAGVLCDVSYNQPVGIFTVVLTASGLIIGILSDMYILSSFTTYYMSCAAVLVLCAFVQMTPIVAVPNNIPTSVILGTATAQTIYTLVMAFPMWFIIRALGRRS